jgi:hypothetical protein
MDIIKKGFIILALIWLSTFYACTIYRTPRVEDSFYKNFEYEFKFRVPTGWEPHRDMPDEIEDGVARYFKDDFVVMLTNPDNRGIVIVSADKADEDIISLGYDKDSFKEKLLERIREREETFTKEYGYENFTYEVGPLTVKEGYGPTFIYKESAKSKEGDKYVRLEYLNVCREDRTCSLAFTLICKEADFDANYSEFSKIADSARKVYQ